MIRGGCYGRKKKGEEDCQESYEKTGTKKEGEVAGKPSAADDPLDGLWKEYEAYTKAASDAARQLAFAGIAVVWIFKTSAGGIFHLDWAPFTAALFFVLGLGCDLLQFLVGALIFGLLGDARSDLPDDQQNSNYSNSVVRPLEIIFLAKFVFFIAGYLVLCMFLLGSLS